MSIQPLTSVAVSLVAAGNGQAAQRADGLFLSVDSGGTVSWKPTIGTDETFTVNDQQTAFKFTNTFVGVQHFIIRVTKIGDTYYVLDGN